MLRKSWSGVLDRSHDVCHPSEQPGLRDFALLSALSGDHLVFRREANAGGTAIEGAERHC